MSIELHIERLVIDEALLRGERADRVRAMIEQELTRGLGAVGVVERLRGIGTLDALPTTALLPATHQGEQLGTRIAAAAQRGLGLSVGMHGRSATRHD